MSKTQEEINEEFSKSLSQFEKQIVVDKARVDSSIIEKTITDFLGKGGDINGLYSTCPYTVETPLIWAVGNGYTAVVEVLLAAGASVDTQGSYGMTALMKAVDIGNAEVTKLLLNKGASVDTQDLFGITALQQAARFGYAEVTKLLLKKGASVDTQDFSGFTALEQAAGNGRADIVTALLAAGASVDIQDKSGSTALQQAARDGHADTVKALLDARASVDIQDKKGNTALMIAASRGATEAVKVLLDHGADPTPLYNKDTKQLKPQYAKLEGMQACFKEYEANHIDFGIPSARIANDGNIVETNTSVTGRSDNTLASSNAVASSMQQGFFTNAFGVARGVFGLTQGHGRQGKGR